jgi:polysaccharide deacetylase family protein (PEP-CTERM system associated)
LEDHYCDLPFPSWGNYEKRLEKTTRVILQLFEKYNVQATFFVLGHIAEDHPELIKDIQAKGHEIASHGYYHRNLKTMNRDEFESDLIKSIDTLERITGEKVLGFREPYFSVNRQQPWFFEIVKRYLKYDSSIFPVKPHYNQHNAPRFIYRISDADPFQEDATGKFIEIPMATLKLPILGNIPIAGGFYLRLFPYHLIKVGISKYNKGGMPAMCYIHPSDLDNHRPKIPGYAWHYYWGLERAQEKFESLLADFAFKSAREVIT